MRQTIKILLLALILLLILALIIPLVIKIPELEDVSSVHELADPDSLFAEVDNFDIHYKTAGSSETTLVMLHGFGSSLYSWREVTPALAESYTVYAYDRPAFGLTERPTTWTGENPYTRVASLHQLDHLLTYWDTGPVVLVGNSAGGSVAMEYTLTHPEKVTALILVSPSQGSGKSFASRFGWIVNSPQMQRMGPLLVRRIAETGLETLEKAWYDSSRQPPDMIQLYTKPLQAENWDVALWHYSTTGEVSQLPDQLGLFDLPILLITGEEDQIIPATNTIELAGKLKGGELVVIPECGHVPQEECPAEFLAAVEDFLAEIGE